MYVDIDVVVVLPLPARAPICIVSWFYDKVMFFYKVFALIMLVACIFICASVFRRSSHDHHSSHSQTTAIFARSPRTFFSAKSIMTILVCLEVLPSLRYVTTHQFEIVLIF